MSPTSDMNGGPPLLPSAAGPSAGQRRLALCVLTALVAALLATAPFARLPLFGTEPLMPAYAAAVLVNESLTAALLLALFSVQRERAVLVLALGYLFSGLMAIPWALTFPGVFGALGLDAGLHGTATIAALRRAGFPLFVIAYALLKDRRSLQASPSSTRRTIVSSAAAISACAVTATWVVVSGADVVPRFMKDARHVADAWRVVPVITLVLYGVGLTLLLRRGRSVLDLWLLVVLGTLTIEVLLLSYLGGGARLSVGWWAGRLFGLASASTVLVVMLSETTTLYDRLARSVVAERRAREARLTAMEALSASVAHEVNQPLASMVTNANAALRWLAKDSPDLEEARAALARIGRDGLRAGKVIEGIKALFSRRGPQERVALDLNALVSEVVEGTRPDAHLAQVTLELHVGAGLPTVFADPIQLQHVLTNLLGNAMEAMTSVSGRPRVLRVSTRRLDEPVRTLVLVEDSGSGLEPEHLDRLFQPFFSTKPGGLGMGLMFCRSIVEAHGGRLWATNNATPGATFQFTLPAGDEPPTASS